MGVIDGRVAIITGGARGIGASISRLFAREGASLVINDLGGAPDGSGGDESPAKQIADEIAERCANGSDAPPYLESFVDRHGSGRPVQLPLPLKGAA